ncbi:MAG: tRNA (adenosine(37)-N6)-threonylcarbamoyltransferase complex dimerization subunit type 1 TsaB [Gracilimonas sp.]|uniref:tRNA (adenosine(37)-N6)-threonylcarbamoyltransferase complex dimerization subunit type 1 TsaB n=2 Tax=Gracilimonas TaxID=649462 RepID=UPI001B08BEEE|nr:tRNA (adenosine(37)-N6)-threonylcarbamoyltransferase complex dimerization subunit type 1 TsaB [Gracilimonas sp.]MBO6587022.1 tRNA (adenosine(37)-N6)-threonylcarbamoyltransferase complex dimerization subunit type 1 TsaB [Gracilimonas sp.]MBO6614490.1 tRNA (adenosine(37)-N6)-threonylcarbamoyltransferase complex dimerization subunit type 1 TsaB [Gracilimonas sp.]
MILAFETATNICSVSFQDDGGEIHEKRTERKGSHSELLFLYVRELMKEHDFSIADLDAALVSTGPGSYTGLRIAASAVKGMLFGLNVDVYAGNTLAGFAQSAGEGTVHAVINARRKHLYHQKFEVGGKLTASSGSEILELTEIEPMLNSGEKIIGTGIGRLHKDKLEGLEVLETTNISANALIALFNSSSGKQFFKKTTAEELESNYLSSSQVNNTSV